MRKATSKVPKAEQARGVYPMSVATDLTGMHAQTLRKYEREGLLQPARTKAGSRRFSALDVGTLRRIGQLADNGVNVEGIRRVLALESRIEGLEARVAGLENALQLNNKPGGTKHDRPQHPRPRRRTQHK